MIRRELDGPFVQRGQEGLCERDLRHDVLFVLCEQCLLILRQIVVVVLVMSRRVLKLE
jgi:hypothetical protein